MPDDGADDLVNAIRAQSVALGFDTIGICQASSLPDFSARLSQFLKAGYHGDMAWMEKRAEWRGNPRKLWPDVRSIIMVTVNYAPTTDPLALLDQTELGNISVYARGKDYHDVVKKRLKQLGRWLIERSGGEIKVFVDTAPVMEKPLGQAAGVGWQGKHTNLVSRELGNWFFLGAIFTTLDLPPDPVETDHCGSCRRCLDVCPTQAFPAPYQLDARKCISYLTIEYDGPVELELRSKLGNRIYGCDDCLAVCPWNKFAEASSEISLWSRRELNLPRLADLAQLGDSGFREVFSGSPIKRIGWLRFLRNVLYAIGNSQDHALLDAASRHRDSSSPTVRDAANWAVAELQKRPDRRTGSKSRQ